MTLSINNFRVLAGLLAGALACVQGVARPAAGVEHSAPAPVAVPAGGLFTSNVVVTLASDVQPLRFTLDGSEPATNSPLYAAPILLTNGCLLQARSFPSNGVPGPLMAESYLFLDTNVVEFTSTLPLVVIHTFGLVLDSKTNIPASLRVIPAGTNGLASLRGDADYEGRAGIKTRGYTSLRYPKKSMAVETRAADGSDQHVHLLGMPKDSDWVLYAPYPDKSLMRDVIAYELSNKMGHYASRTRYVEVFLNDTARPLNRTNYVGIYVLEEKVKRGEHRVDLKKLSPADTAEPEISGGYIFKKDHLDEVERKEAAAAAAAAPTPATGRTRSLAGRPGYPTGPGGFPADPAGFLPAFVEPPETNLVTFTNITLATNITLFTNHVSLAMVAVTTNILATYDFSWTTNILPVTNITLLTNILASTNIAALTNVAAFTNRAAIANLAPFPGEVVFTNFVTLTNVAVFTNIAFATNIAALTNIAFTTNVLTLTNIVARTSLVPSTNTVLIAQITASTNVTAITNLTLATTVLNPVPPSPIPSKLSPFLTRLVETGQGFLTGRSNSFYFVEPRAERITPAQREWLSNYVNRFEVALNGPAFRDATNGYPAFIDADSFIDHHLMVEVTKNIDGFRFSTFFHKDRGGKIKMEPVWDWNLSLGNARGREGYNPANWYWPQLDDRQYSWFRRLFEDPDFGQRYVDRWAELRASVFVTSNLHTRIDQLAASLREPAARNFQRWPILGERVGPEYFTGKTWLEETDYLKGWISNRLAWVSAQFLPAPALAANEAALAGGAPLSFNLGTGRILFTLDGTDPRQPGGEVLPAAKVYEQPVPLSGNVNLFARVQLGNRWSSPLRIHFAARPPATLGGG